MKKIFLGLIAIVSLLSSCQDDDFTMIDPAPVSVAADDIIEIVPNESIAIDLLGNDNLENDTEIIYVDEESVEGGKITLNTNGTYTYVPKENYIGEDSFSYTICTGGIVSEDTCTTGIVEITVEPINYTLTAEDYDLIVSEFENSNLSDLIDDLEESNFFDVNFDDDFGWSDEELEEVFNFIIETKFDEAVNDNFYRVFYNIENEEEDIVFQYEEIEVVVIEFSLSDDDYDLIVAELTDVEGFEAQVSNLDSFGNINRDGGSSNWSDAQIARALNIVIENNYPDASNGDLFIVTFDIFNRTTPDTEETVNFEFGSENLVAEEGVNSYEFESDDYKAVVTAFTGVEGFEDLIPNLEQFGNFNRSGSATTWGDYQLLQALSEVLNNNITAEEGDQISVTYDAFNGGSTSAETKILVFVDGGYQYFVEDVFVGGSTDLSFNISGDISDYYSSLTATSSTDNLFGLLNTITVSAHTMDVAYTPGIWDTLKEADANPDDNSEVLLIYGFNDQDGQENSRTRPSANIATDTGGSPDFWNREHVFPRSLGSPNLEFVGPGADAHHLRASDPNINSSRSNNKFSDGSGEASFRTTDGGWYPGDEWKGDVARMIMYMYVRYQGQCLPSAVANGDTNSIDPNMVDIFLEWNIEDPVSEFEKQRNDVIEGAQGNRNPFIDNPYLATLIWGGDAAENTWE